MRLKTGLTVAWLVLGVYLFLIGSFPGILWFIVFAIIIWAIPSRSEKISKESALSDTSNEISSVSQDGLGTPPKLPPVSNVVSKSDSKYLQNNGTIENP